MRIPFFVVCLILQNACGVQTESKVPENLPTTVSSPQPNAEDGPLQIPKMKAVPLSREQRRELDAALPPLVREILEKATVIDVLGLSSEDKAGIGWHPDVKVTLPVGSERADLLSAFFFDASAGPNPSACFIPRHGLRATYKGKSVEVIICYQCHLFAVNGDLGEFSGGFYKAGSAAHHLFENLLRTKRGQ